MDNTLRNTLDWEEKVLHKLKGKNTSQEKPGSHPVVSKMECVHPQWLHKVNPLEYRKKIMKLLFILFFSQQQRKTEHYLLMHTLTQVPSLGPCVSQSRITCEISWGKRRRPRTLAVALSLLPLLLPPCALLPFPYAQLSGFMGYIILMPYQRAVGDCGEHLYVVGSLHTF